LTVSTYNDFSQGMVRDAYPGVAPKNSVYDALDVLFDIPGKIRRRGTTDSFAASSTANLRMFGILNGGSGRYYAIRNDGAIGVINRSTDAFVQIAGFSSSPGSFGQPVQFQTVLMFPTSVGIAAVGGTDETIASASYSPPTSTVATVTAGNPLVSFSGGAFTANSRPGDFVYIFDTASGGTRNIYLGRIQAALTNTSFYVDPTPKTSFTATQSGTTVGTFVRSGLSAFSVAANANTPYSYSAACIAAFQNRVLMGNVTRKNSSTVQSETFPRSVFYTVLPADETPSTNGSAQGATWLYSDSIELNNRFDVGGIDSIIALAPIDDNQLLILTASGAWRLTGYLETRVANDVGGLTFDVHPIPHAPGCMSELSVQQTKYGLVYANESGIYLYNKNRFENLLEGRNQAFWSSLNGPNADVEIHGSYVLNRDTYVISIGSLGFGGATPTPTTLAIHLPTRAATRFSSLSLVLITGAADDQAANTTVGLRWWDYSLSPTTVTGGQIMRLSNVTDDPLNINGTSSATDTDGHVPTPTIVTQLLEEGAPQQMKRFWRSVWRHVGKPTVKLQKIEDILTHSATLTTIGTPALDNTRAAFTGPTIISEAVQYTITAAASDTEGFEFLGFDHYFDELPARA
jgi:hypothetical protein